LCQVLSIIIYTLKVKSPYYSYHFYLFFHLFFSPERRFKSVSPCRRLFEELSTNQNSPSPSGFVVSNGHLATPNSSFSSFNNNNNKNNNHNGNTLSNNCSFSDVLVAKLGGHSSNILETTNIAKQQVLEGLTDILYSSYQRRRNINNTNITSNSTSNSNNNNINNILNQNSNLLSSPFMDDLGFLSTSSTSNTVYQSSMKKSPMVIYNEDEEFNNENNDNDNINDNDNNNFLMSSPMKIKEIPMKSCSIRKHWNHQQSNIRPRRSMSENFVNTSPPKVSENGLIHHLPCFDSPHDAIKRISPDTLTNLLEEKFSGIYERIFIIDCRYPYEFEGGHIPSALNISSPDAIEKLLMEDPKGNTLILFHCEFSSERAPRMALHVRNLDRQLNKSNYPSLYYPEMYILDGGYKNYWQQHGDKCEPPHSYLPMRNPQYRDQLRHYQKIKYAFKSGCHLSQHSTIKTLPPKCKKARSKSLNVANARKFFNDLISGDKTEEVQRQNTSNDHLEGDSSSIVNNLNEDQNHMFPSYTISMTNSFSSIFASELDTPSEMDIE
jgi:rhodanese-related sulfurtransferase